MFEDRFAGQGSYKYNLSATAGTHLPKFPSWPEDQLRHAEYVAVFPNVLLGIQADHAFAMMIDPIAPEQTIEKLRLYYVGDESLDPKYDACREATLESWKVVFAEDVFAVETMQKVVIHLALVVEFSLQRWIYRLTSSKNGWRLKLKKLWRHNMQHYLNYVDGQWRDASRQLKLSIQQLTKLLRQWLVQVLKMQMLQWLQHVDV